MIVNEFALVWRAAFIGSGLRCFARRRHPTDIVPGVRRPLALLLTFGAGGALFGAAISHIPAPEDPALFWIGNFSAPWAVLPFLTGRAQRSWSWAAAAGLAADVACVAGFYAGFITAAPGRLGMPASTPTLELVITGLADWLGFIAPWVVLATATGLGYGLIGWWWRWSRSLVAGVAVVAPFIVEPLAWRLYRGFLPGPLYVWLVELAVGAGALVWMISRLRLPARQRL